MQQVSKAYPTKEGDIVVKCPVCERQVVVQQRGKYVEILFHNERKYGTPCNGTAKIGLLTKIPADVRLN